jgi:hypothetical protein
MDDAEAISTIVARIHEASNKGEHLGGVWNFIKDVVDKCAHREALLVHICWAIMQQEERINPRRSTVIEMAKCKCSMKDCSNGAVPVVAGKALCEQCLMLITTLPAKSILTRVKKLQQEAVGLVHNIMHAVMKDDAT